MTHQTLQSFAQNLLTYYPPWYRGGSWLQGCGVGVYAPMNGLNTCPCPAKKQGLKDDMKIAIVKATAINIITGHFRQSPHCASIL